MVCRLSRSCLLAKTDLKNAYHSIPGHPDDRPLLTVSWEDPVFLDAALPFGLRSAPKIFSAVADALLWILTHSEVKEAIHYLTTSYLLVSRGQRNVPITCMALALQIFEMLGIPVATKKNESPSTAISYLGILIDM